MSGTRIKVLFPIDENVPMNKCYEATSNESMYNASTLDVLEDEAEKKGIPYGIACTAVMSA